MPSKQNALVLTGVLAATFMVFALFVLAHSSFYTCIGSAARDYREDHSVYGQKAIPSVPAFFGYPACAAKIARHDSDAITAMATALLAVITLWLVFLGMEQSRTTKAQLRAYLSVRIAEGMPPRFDPHTGPWCALNVKNTGQTPAFGMTFWIRAALGPVDFAGELPGNTDDAVPHPMTLTPNAEVRMLTVGPAPQEGVAALFAAGQMAAYAYGEINFKDAFGADRFHRFRYTYTINDIQGGVQGARLSPIGNDAN